MFSPTAKVKIYLRTSIKGRKADQRQIISERMQSQGQIKITRRLWQRNVAHNVKKIYLRHYVETHCVSDRH
jgi:hypothetical protein